MFSLLLAAALVIDAGVPQQSPTVAILELKTHLKGAERRAIDIGYLSGVVRSGALSLGGLRVMTHENMLALLAPTGRKLEDCEGECEVETGRKLGADAIVSGELLRFGESYKVALRLHDTREGWLLSSVQASGATAAELEMSIQHELTTLYAPLAARIPAATAVGSAIPQELRALAAEASSAPACEQSARAAKLQAAERGWVALRACIERGTFSRGVFTDLRGLLGEAWEKQMQSRSDAGQLLAKVIALRGGDVEGDLELLQQHRVPLFSLLAAQEQPDAMHGRFLVLRARVGESVGAGLALRETSLHSRGRELAPRYQPPNRATGRYTNVVQETGRGAIVRGARDPFLSRGKEFIFLARVDGVQDGQPALSLIAYFEPNPLLVD